MGGFGTETTPGAVVGTKWDGKDIWIRRAFRLGKWDAEMAFLEIHHDEDAEVYVNGKLIATFAGFTTSYVPHEATQALKEALKVGENTIAVHCHQEVGGQFIDVGIRIAE